LIFIGAMLFMMWDVDIFVSVGPNLRIVRVELPKDYESQLEMYAYQIQKRNLITKKWKPVKSNLDGKIVSDSINPYYQSYQDAKNHFDRIVFASTKKNTKNVNVKVLLQDTI